MAIKSKNSGAYADIVGVSVKTAGTYAAVHGIYAKSGGVYGSVLDLGPKTFSVTLSGITGATPSSVSSVVTIDQVGNLNPIITANRTSGVGPLAIVFDATTTQIAPSLSSMPFFEVYYDWDFGDATAAAQTWSRGTRPGLNSRNTAFGPVAAHVFDGAGNHTVTLRARYRGINGVLHTKTTTIAVSVSAADAVFSSNTVYVSQSSLPVAGVGGVPAGANVQQVPNWSGMSALSATYKRIFLKADDNWATDGSASLASGPGIVGRYGTGANPKVTLTAAAGGFGFYSGGDWRLIDLEITSDLVESQNKVAVSADSASPHILLYRCNINNVQSGLSSSIGALGIYLVDSIIDTMFAAPVEPGSHGGPCAFLDITDNIVLLGSLLARAKASHGVRLQGTSRSVVSNCRFESADFNYHLLTIRGKSNVGNVGVWSGTWSENNVVSDNVFDGSLGGIYTVHSGPQATSHAERVRNLLIERNHIIGGDLSGVQCSVTGLTVRHNIISVAHSAGIEIGGGNAAGVPSPSNNFVYNNTIVKRDLSIDAYFSAVVLNGGGQANIMIFNNLAYAPGTTNNTFQNSGFPEFVSAGGGSTSANYQLGSNTSNARLLTINPFGVSMPSSASEFTPVNYGVNSGEFVPTFSDYYNVEIVGTRDMGAIQV